MPEDPMITELLDDLESQASTARLAGTPAGRALADDLTALIAAHRSGARISPAGTPDAERTDAGIADPGTTDTVAAGADPLTQALGEVMAAISNSAMTGAHRDLQALGLVPGGGDDVEGEPERHPLALVFRLSADGGLSDQAVTDALAELAPTFDDAYSGVAYGAPVRVDADTVRVDAVAADGYGVPGTVAFSGTVGSPTEVRVIAVVPADVVIDGENGEMFADLAARAAAIAGGPDGLDTEATMDFANVVAGEMLGLDEDEARRAEANMALVVTYRRADGQTLDGAELDAVAARGLTSLAAFGNLIETRRTVGEDGSWIVYETHERGRLTLAALSVQVAAWRGSLPFPGIGVVHASAAVTELV